MKKLLSLLLALVLVAGLLPMAASAEDLVDPGVAPTFTVTASAVCYTKSDMKTEVGTANTISLEQTEPVTINGDTFGPFLTYKNKLYEYIGVFFEGALHGSVTVNYDVSLKAVYVPHTHHYTQRYNRTYHWMGCRCGSVIQKYKHVDPATDDDSICTCGYEFRHDANLVSLNLRNIYLSPRFDRNTTEYIGEVITYKDVTTTHIACRTNDALATVEISGGTAIEEGLNVYSVTVTAEDRKTTKTYTVYACKPTKADGVFIYNLADKDGAKYTSASPKAKSRYSTTTLTLSETTAKSLAEQAAINESAKIILDIQCNKWSIKTIDVIIPSAGVKAIAEECKADLVIRSFMGDVTIPNAELAAFAAEEGDITFRVTKEPSVALSVFAGEKSLATPAGVTIDAE